MIRTNKMIPTPAPPPATARVLTAAEPWKFLFWGLQTSTFWGSNHVGGCKELWDGVKYNKMYKAISEKLPILRCWMTVTSAHYFLMWFWLHFRTTLEVWALVHHFDLSTWYKSSPSPWYTYASFRLTCRSPLCRYAAWHRLMFQSCSSQRQRRFGFSPSGNRSRVE